MITNDMQALLRTCENMPDEADNWLRNLTNSFLESDGELIELEKWEKAVLAAQKAHQAASRAALSFLDAYEKELTVTIRASKEALRHRADSRKDAAMKTILPEWARETLDVVHYDIMQGNASPADARLEIMTSPHLSPTQKRVVLGYIGQFARAARTARRMDVRGEIKRLGIDTE